MSKKIYGTDIRMVKRNDGLWDILPGNNGDFEIIKDEDAAIQLMALALSISFGELKTNPDFGCNIYDLLGQPPTPIVKSFIRVFIYETLMRLSFVESVQSVECYSNDDESVINIIVEVKLIANVEYVESEAHNYNSSVNIYQTNNNNVITIEDLRGYVNGNIVSFTKDVDYERVGDNISFMGRVPDDGTPFLIDYYYLDINESYEPKSIILTYPFRIG